MARKTAAAKKQAEPRLTLPEVEVVPIETVRPYFRNPRKNDAAVPGVVESIRRYGMNAPLVVDRKGVLIVGHTRYRALVELGAKTVPVIRPNLTAQQAAEYRVADNKTGEKAVWDDTALGAELRLMGDGAMAPFFVEADLARLLDDSNGMGAGYAPVNEEQMDRVLDRQQKGMADLTKPRIEAQIKLECPHCGEEFFMDRSTIETHPGER